MNKEYLYIVSVVEDNEDKIRFEVVKQPGLYLDCFIMWDEEFGWRTPNSEEDKKYQKYLKFLSQILPKGKR